MGIYTAIEFLWNIMKFDTENLSQCKFEIRCVRCETFFCVTDKRGMDYYIDHLKVCK